MNFSGKINYLFFITAALLLFSCGQKPGDITEDVTGQTTSIDRTAATTITALSLNTALKVTLNQCIGCDPSLYAWKILKIDSTILKPAGVDFKSNACKDCDGGNGDKTFIFKAIEKGTTELTIAIYGDTLNFPVEVK